MGHKKEIDIYNEEYWWGGAVTEGKLMPYKAPYKADITVNRSGNQAMPMLISNKGRTIWSDSGFSFEFTGDNKIEISGAGEILLENYGGDLRNALKNAGEKHFKNTGKIPGKELFIYPQYNTWIELMYEQSEDAIIKYAKDILKNGYPSGVLMIDDNWQEDYGVWEFSKKRFNDPKGMMKKLHDMGFVVMLWVCPFISADSMTFRELRTKGLLVRDVNYDIAIREWWNGYSAVLDLTNPEAVDWFQGRLDGLMEEYDADGFKFDAGGAIHYKDDDKTYNPDVTANDQCMIFNQIGEKYTFNEYREAWNSAGLGLAQRLCDKKHSWEDNGLQDLIPDSIAQGLVGYPYACPDMIGGGQYINFLSHSKNLDEELFVRCAQCSALFPMMQFSAAPWRVLSKENETYCREAANLHVKLGEYIYLLAQNSVKNNEPILRHMAYQYPNNDYENLTSQFMLGDKVLVAPVVNKGAATKTIHFPDGTWTGDNGSEVKGPCIKEVDAPLGRLPYYMQKK